MRPSGRTQERPATAKDNFQSWLDKKVAPHLEPKAEPGEAQIQSLVEEGHRFSDAGSDAFPNFSGDRVSLARIVLPRAPCPDQRHPQALLDRYL